MYIDAKCNMLSHYKHLERERGEGRESIPNTQTVYYPVFAFAL